jgi:hypothetical protein
MFGRIPEFTTEPCCSLAWLARLGGQVQRTGQVYRHNFEPRVAFDLVARAAGVRGGTTGPVIGLDKNDDQACR